MSDEARTFRFVHRNARQIAAAYCESVADGWTATFNPPRRSDAQSALMHSMAGDLAKQVTWCGAKLSKDDWKRVATAMLKKDRFVRDVGGDGQPGNGLIVIGAQTRNMGAKDIGHVIDWFEWFGAQQTPKVVWSHEEAKVAQLSEMRR